jgi:ADP-heptose:LPS heptosyltransferase
MKRVLLRVKVAISWRWRGLLLRYFGKLARIGPRFHIHARWPWPIRKPWRRKRLRLYPIEGGLGDELMCSPILAEIKRRNPACEITFCSRFPSLFESNPHIDHLEKFRSGENEHGHGMIYRNAKPPPRPLMAMMAECVGLILEHEVFTQPDLHEVSPDLKQALAAIPEPQIVIQPKPGKWTPNKEWPADHWRELVGDLLDDYNVIEVGDESIFKDLESPRFYSFAEKTDLQEFAYIISKATLFIGAPSSGMHFARIFNVPASIIFGGYESPAGYRYEFENTFYNPVPCAPCWLTTPCPFDHKCLRGIESTRVIDGVRRSLSRIVARNQMPPVNPAA